MIDNGAAVEWVLAHGDESDGHRLATVLTGVWPAPLHVADALFADQTPEGGFPAPWSADAPSVAATCDRLARIIEWDLRYSSRADRCADWLAALVPPDGTVRSSVDTGHLPSQDPLYLTANVGWGLAVVDRPEAAGRAARAVRDAVAASGAWPTCLTTTWLAAALLWAVGLREEADQGLDILARRLLDAPPADVARAGCALRTALLPSGHPVLAAVVRRLTTTQRPDGSWPVDGPPAEQVAVAITAIGAVAGLV
ncbi:hypothetical protein ACGF7U_16515 [Micromonospora sp. NPDC047670]|uniref:hypothetical protein n=1 Tax=Micromonospora sp. NPDC047670 TaxID=3364252 RepID=UPI0037194AC7